MSNIEQYAADFHGPRCGNCHHAMDSTTAGIDMVACSIFLEYRSADQLGGCEHHVRRSQIATGDSAAN